MDIQYRWDIINALIEKNNYTSYLEIGYYKGWSFDQIKIQHKTAVDPNPSKNLQQEAMPYGNTIVEEPRSGGQSEISRPLVMIVKSTSDEFFKEADKWQGVEGAGGWDIIFIDGLHEAEQVYRDIKNAINHLSPGGTIVMHDCSPPKYEHTTTGIDGCWTGDTYKAVLKFRDETYGEWNFKCVDTDWGVGIIQKEEYESFTLCSFLQGFHNYENTWEYFDQNRKELLDLISVEEFKERYL